MEVSALRLIKRWLNLSRCFTTSALHHPNVIDNPLLSDLRTKAKMTFLSFISTLKDSLIEEIQSILINEEYCKSQKIKQTCVDLLHRARRSISTITRRTLGNLCRSALRQIVVEDNVSRLRELSVQTKILEVSELENSNQVWKRILQGLPAGHMSFLLRAGMDTLPTTLNLRRWKLRADSSCPYVDISNQQSFTFFLTSLLH